jgi:hypothetical protein
MSDADSNDVGLHDLPRISDLVRHWSIVTKRELIRNKNGKATGAKDTEVENVGNQIADWLDQIHACAMDDRKLLYKLLEERNGFDESMARIEKLVEEM